MPSGPMYEANLIAKRTAIPNDVFMVEKDKTPKFSLLRQAGVEDNLLGQVILEKFPATPSTGVLDGTPVTTVKYVTREQADVCGQHFREPWGVTKLAALTSTHGVKDEVGHQRKWAMMKIRRQLEIQIGSNADGAVQSGETPWTTRGIMQWLNPSAQAERPVPANFRPASATRYTGAMTKVAFTDDALRAMFLAAFDETKDPLDLDLFVGSTAKDIISQMTQADPYRVEGTEELKQKVMVVDFDFGYARVHLDPFIAWDPATGAATAYSPLSGIGINLKQWGWEWLKGNSPANEDLPNDGSGRRGFIDAVGRLWSRNPQGQVSIYTATST